MTWAKPAEVLQLSLQGDWVLHVSPHRPGDGTLTFDLCNDEADTSMCSDMTVESARVLRDYLTEWLDGGAR